MEDFTLPLDIAQMTEQKTVPIGDGALAFNDMVLAAETCEELFTPSAPHIYLALSGVEVIGNGSGSHHQVRQHGFHLLMQLSMIYQHNLVV